MLREKEGIMFTEKTQGKIELLESYLSENYVGDVTLKTILDSILSDVKTQAKVAVAPVQHRQEVKVEPKKQATKTTVKKYPEVIDLSKVNKGNFKNLVNKKLETKKWNNSTILNKATYDKSTKVLTVYGKRGIVNEYQNVPVSVKDSLFDSGKPGKTYNSYIQGVYKSKDLSLVR